MIAGAVSADVNEPQLRTEVARLAGVTLTTGYIPVPDVPSYFDRARCVVLPYKRSSQSGVAHLAHTLRRPVIATRVGDIPNVVLDGVSGILVPSEDPAALAVALVRLLKDPELAQRMGEAGAQGWRNPRRGMKSQHVCSTVCPLSVCRAFRARLPQREGPLL